MSILFDTDDELTVGDVFIRLFAIVRAIPLYLLKIIGFMVGFPNTKITYKSGRCEYYFFLNIKWKHTDNKITSIEWLTCEPKRPMHMNIDEIETIVQIY